MFWYYERQAITKSSEIEREIIHNHLNLPVTVNVHEHV